VPFHNESAIPEQVRLRVALMERFSNCDALSKAILLNFLAKAHYTTLDALSKKSEQFRAKLLQSIQPMMDEIQAILDAHQIRNPLAE
jgi:hypothetical protein